MVVKILWDWATYWSINTLLFINNGLTNIDFMLKLVSGPTALMNKYGELSLQMQRLFKEWEPYDTSNLTDRYIDPFDLDFLKNFQEDIVEKQIGIEELDRKLIDNFDILEHFAAETFRLISNMVHGTSMDITVDPYSMTLDTNNRVKSKNSKMMKRNDYVVEELKNLWLYKYPA